ncbi:uncharacterized protein LOC112528297 isoform X2 [Cynara cardunculus var. scolymus]|uniref:uncharacterized protein LOC112528297 isoform X2 n=1 Tax=Cynara cardunculus var. scolymus TaxID=59895 RepID=UPI000D629603|nr:uncharacterized protein LOC112528297 isoform X2 [Cynara cardunculus var. scolymus]
MADKPSRGLVLYGDGLTRFVNPSHTHLHSLAAQSVCGFLSLPHFPPTENVDGTTVGEFLNLVDAYEDYTTLSGESQDKCITPTISERSALITENIRLRACGGKLGLSVLQSNKLINNSSSLVDSPVNLVAMELLKLLGIQGEKVLDTSQFDLVFVHVGACEEGQVGKYTEYINSLVGEIISKAKPESEIGSRLHLSVVLSFGDTSKDDESIFSLSNKNRNMDSNFASLFPSQSYRMKGSNPRSNVRDYCPMMIAQWQDAVTRKDTVETFSFQDFLKNGGNLTIPADRFVHEVAFKLWKAPKYGA